jgi:hypothetical protein
MNGKRSFWWSVLALLIMALGLYLATLDNGLRLSELAGGDLVTHQYAQVQGRPSNAPGYPLYTMGGWLWYHGWRAVLGASANPTAILSSFSTLWALVALGLLYWIVVDLTGKWWLGLFCGLFYAVTYFFWYYAVTTEQYTSAVALTLAIVLVAFQWEDAENAGSGSATRADRYLLILAFLCGLTLAHLVTVAFIVPPLIWFVLSRKPDVLRQRGLVLKSLLLVSLPLLSYGFVYIRGAQYPEWRGAGQWDSTWSWFWDFLSTQQGRDELTWSLRPLWTVEYPSFIWQELTWVVLIGGLAGLALVGRRRGIFLGSTLLIYLAFSFVDRLGNWFQVIMPAYALLVLTFAALVDWLVQRVGAWAEGPLPPLGRFGKPVLQAALLVALLALVLVRFERSWPQANQHDRSSDDALLPGQAILADNPVLGGAVLGVYTETLSLRYLTDIWQVRPDVDSVSSEEAQELLALEMRPVYVTTNAAPLVWREVDADAHLSAAGRRLIAVRPTPPDLPPRSAQPLNLSVGQGLNLVAYQLVPREGNAEQLDVLLYWQADAPISDDWSVSIRPTLGGQLLADDEGEILQVDLSDPVHGTYPTSRWTPGEVVADSYVLPILSDQPVDGLQVIVYRPLLEGGFDNLAVLQLDLP